MKIDKELFSSKGLVYYEANGLGIFDFGSDGLARVKIDGDVLVFVPERSSMHKRVLGVLNG
jgi:RNase P/RNase MRP subunit p29